MFRQPKWKSSSESSELLLPVEFSKSGSYKPFLVSFAVMLFAVRLKWRGSLVIGRSRSVGEVRSFYLDQTTPLYVTSGFNHLP